MYRIGEIQYVYYFYKKFQPMNIKIAIVDDNTFLINAVKELSAQVEELKAKLKVSAHKFTATAKAAIEAAGGEAVTL